MSQACGEKAIPRRAARIVLDREQQFWHGFIEAPAEKMRGAYYSERRANSDAGTETHRGLDMLDAKIGITRPMSEYAVDVPAARAQSSARSQSQNLEKDRLADP